MAKAIVLDVGCGRAKTPGSIGLDANPLTEADILMDLCSPWPLRHGIATSVVSHHVIEHVPSVEFFLNEIAAVAAAGCDVLITTPHFSSPASFIDPTHVRHMSVRSLDYFCEPYTTRGPANWPTRAIQRLLGLQITTPDFYISKAHFRMKSVQLTFAPIFRILGVSTIANRAPQFYETYLCSIFPARSILYRLERI